MEQLQDNKGFTMLEMMLVLLTVSIILLFTLNFKWTNNYLVEHEINNIQAFFDTHQLRSKTSKENITIVMNAQNNYLESRSKNGTVLNQLDLKYCNIYQSSFTRFTYLSNGDMNAFGTTQLYCNKKVVKFVFQIQKGRYRIER